jgi:hypothetical protein
MAIGTARSSSFTFLKPELKDPFFRDLNFAFLGFFLGLGFKSLGA